MKSIHLLLMVLLCAVSTSWADTAAPALPAHQSDLRILRERLAQKRSAKAGVEAYASEAARFDELLHQYRGQPDAEADILWQKAAFLDKFLNDEAAAKETYGSVRQRFPGSRQAELAERALHQLSPQGRAELAAARAAAQAKREVLQAGLAPEIEFAWSSNQQWQKLSDLRGKVVVLDFWATWCGPCIRSFPNLRKEVAHFAGSPVVFLGPTRLYGKVHGLEAKPIDVKDDPAQEYTLTARFKEKNEMTWDVVFVPEQTFKDYLVGAIPNVVIIDPAGKVRHLGLNPLMPTADIAGKVTAILQEFGLPLPPKV